MTNQDNTAVLERAIRVAIENGWKWQNFEGPGYFPSYLKEPLLVRHIAVTMNDMRLEHLIYNQQFAKALFGSEFKPYTICWYKLEGEHMKDPDDFVAQHHYTPAWQYHLQQMVISPDPIKYIAANMPGGED